MLDVETKRRIDTARDILVGKVPNPQSQVEQITIALIYKFMDDMDAEAEELGGKRTFFSGEFERYGWAKLLDVSLGGQETLNRYAEAIEKMNQNQNIPPLFRDIFKNAFLPYRDPETLKMFLKTINEFKYDHSERLGDAFEYLLSIMSSQGDAGQFRTPRHIIDFMVELVDPKKEDRILDPACGTAGFLISAYKHIMAEERKNAVDNQGMTPDERTKLMENFEGYDISPDMVRLSLVNMYLHGFTTPRIHEYDTLTSEDKWNEFADVILANPPFMSPKGGIRPHSRFSVESNRSEVLFVDYIMEHLTPNGRAAVIVPEGIIFQNGIAYKALRKKLVEEDYLVGVISLPAGVFNPYSGVKTSILWIDRALARKMTEIIFCKIENDGYDLGAQRRPNGKDDLPIALASLSEYKPNTVVGRGITVEAAKNLISVDKKQLGEGGEFNLSEERHRKSIRTLTKYKNVPLGEVAIFTRGPFGSSIKREVCVPKGKNTYKVYEQGNIIQNDFDRGEYYLTEDKFKELERFELLPNDIVLTCAGTLGKTSIVPHGIERGIINSVLMRIRVNEKIINRYYLELILKSPQIQGGITDKATGVALKNLFATSELKQFIIPLPPLDVQGEIVSEIKEYQKIIDGARMVVENYRPHIEVDPSWPVVKLGELCETTSGGTPLRSKPEYYENGNIPWLKSGEVSQGFIYGTEEKITFEGLKNSSAKLLPINTVLVAMYGATAGQIGLLKIETTTNQAVCAVLPNEKYIPEYLFYYLKGKTQELLHMGTGGAQPNISQSIIKNLLIPLPPMGSQREIVVNISKEQSFIDANIEIIKLFNEKMHYRIAKVWGE